MNLTMAHSINRQQQKKEEKKRKEKKKKRKEKESKIHIYVSHQETAIIQSGKSVVAAEAERDAGWMESVHPLCRHRHHHHRHRHRHRRMGAVQLADRDKHRPTAAIADTYFAPVLFFSFLFLQTTRMMYVRTVFRLLDCAGPHAQTQIPQERQNLAMAVRCTASTEWAGGECQPQRGIVVQQLSIYLHTYNIRTHDSCARGKKGEYLSSIYAQLQQKRKRKKENQQEN